MNPQDEAQKIIETIFLVFGSILTSHGLLKFIPPDINPIWMVIAGIGITTYGVKLLRSNLR